MWNKLRVWMIKKLGGYVYPVQIERIAKQDVTPFCAKIIVSNAEEYYLEGMLPKERESYIKEQLAIAMGKEIIKHESVYCIERCDNFGDVLCTAYRMRVLLVNMLS